MNYLTLFEEKTLFNELWPLLDLRAKLDLRWTKVIEWQKKRFLNGRLLKHFWRPDKLFKEIESGSELQTGAVFEWSKFLIVRTPFQLQTLLF